MRLTRREARLRIHIGRRLRSQRGEWSLSAVSRVAGLSKSYLSEVERGRQSISVMALTRWTRALGCSVREFAQEVPALDLVSGRAMSARACSVGLAAAIRAGATG